MKSMQASLNLGDKNMSTKWTEQVLSDVAYERLLCEVTVSNGLLFVLDQEDGKNNPAIAFFSKNNELIFRTSLEDFKIKLDAAVRNLIN
jgi:hypothetical protein